MTDSPSHLALRELRADFSNPKGLLALAGVGILLGLSGPFETYGFLSLLPRTVYWLFVTFATYGIGALINIYMQYRWGERLGLGVLRIITIGVAIGCGVMCALSLINWVVFGQVYETANSLFMTFLFVTLISVIINGLLTVLSPYPDSDAAGLDAPSTAPPLLLRLPLAKRGTLVSLSVDDHYVHVVTTRGSEMILMRLSDAITETAPANGLQVHRSHWVALDQIKSAKRSGDRAVLTMTTGTDIPASRSYIPALRDAGVFPTARNG